MKVVMYPQYICVSNQLLYIIPTKNHTKTELMLQPKILHEFTAEPTTNPTYEPTTHPIYEPTIGPPFTNNTVYGMSPIANANAEIKLSLQNEENGQSELLTTN
eukprot:305629_1